MSQDAILFQDNEEELLEMFLVEHTKDYRNYALQNRTTRGVPWNREKIVDIVNDMKKEFQSEEMGDAVQNSMLPPLQAILDNNRQLVSEVEKETILAELQVTNNLKVIVSFQEKSSFEPHFTIAAGAEENTIHAIINGLHPYYSSLESPYSINECLRQYIYDAIAEFRVSQMSVNSRDNPNSIRRFKDDLLRVHEIRLDNLEKKRIELEISLPEVP